MKRSSLLFFALVLLQLFFVSEAFAATTVTAVSLTRNIDADANGYTNFNDTVRVEAIATYTGATAWAIPPVANFSDFGLGPVIMTQQNAATGLYRADIRLTEWVAGLNYNTLVDVIVTASANDGTNASSDSNDIYVDLDQVLGTNPDVSPLQIKNGQNITIAISDTKYQATPLGGTTANVNLTPIGGGNNVPIPYVSGTNFSLTLDATTQTYLNNREYTGPLTISLKDPLNPLVQYISNDFVLDTRPPVVNAGETRVTIMSGNATALAGDVIRLTATVSNYDNETVYVSVPDLTGGANPAAIQTGLTMNLISSSGANNPAVWQTDVVLSQAAIKSNAIVASFTFIDDTGNSTVVNRTFAIDLDTPAYNYLNANCLQPNLADSPYDVATSTCWVEIVASIPINVTPDNLTVTADLSPIGGPAAQAMTGSLVTDYRCVYQINPGTTEDAIQYTFVVTARDTAGNLVLQATTPAVRIDNVVPTIGNITITSGQPTVLHGEDFTITVEANQIESGQVQVDLAALGLGMATLNLQSGNLYSRTFPLPEGDGTPAFPYFEGRASFTVYVNDTIQTPAVPAHTVTATTPSYSFYNRDLTISANVLNPNNTDSPNNYATATCKLELIATIPVSGSITPLSVSVDLSSIGGPASLNMTQVPSTDNYRAVYTINAGALEDDNSWQFLVTALDKFGTRIVQRYTSPAIAIDSTLPVINSAVLTSTDNPIKVGSLFTVTVNATGVENGSVSVNLSSIGSPAAVILPQTAANTFSASFVLANSSVAGLARDELTGFPVAVSDTVFDPTIPDNVIGHLIQGNTNQMPLDNEPPLIQIATYTMISQKNPPYVIIGDQVMLEVQLASTSASPAFDGHTVTADLRDAGLNAAQALTFAGGKFTYTFTVATGTTNLGATFPLTITDNATNAPATGTALTPVVASISIPLFDQNPPDPGMLKLTVTRRTAQITDSGDNNTLVNHHKNLHFNLPFTREIIDDHATATIYVYQVAQNGLEYVDDSLKLIAGPGDFVRMTASDTASYTLVFDVATFTADKSDRYAYPYSFVATMYDRSGNLFSVQTDPNIRYRTDCYIPTIASVSAMVIGGGTARVGSQILYRAEILDNIDEIDGWNRVPPTIDLSSFGLDSATPMTNNPSGSDWYELTTTVPAGTFNGTNESWMVKVRDGGRNFVASQTQPVIPVDNKAPIINSMTVTWQGMPAAMRSGILATFTISLDAAETLGTATVDLTAIGGPASAMMNADNLAKTFTLATTTAVTSREYTNYKFTAKVTDPNANEVTIESNAVTSVDCHFPSFSNYGIVISQTNGDNPLAGVSNINDILVVFASVSASIDAVASATLSSGTTHIATASLVFNAASNRHEASFTVGNDLSNWGPLVLNSLTYQLSAIDDALNVATISTGISTFTVKNVAPQLASHSFWLSPNNDLIAAGSNLFLNVASGTSPDLLLASATFLNGAQVTSAYLNLSAITGAPAKLAITALSGSVASTSTGVNLSTYSQVEDTTAEFSITLLDEAGNAATGSQTFRVDTKRPAITSAEFDGTRLNVSFSEIATAPAPLMWRLVGSNTVPIGSVVKMELGSDTLATSSLGFFDYEFILTSTGRKTVAGWASTPLYLELLSTDTAPIKDLAGNWLPKANFQPIAITDSSFREPARITSLTMTHTWPASITLDFAFNKTMATDTSFVASDAVLFVDNPPAGIVDPFDQVDYRAAYCFQASDTIGMQWNAEGTTLRIIMSTTGRDWIAKKLGAGAKTLKFAQRNSGRRFLKDDLDKPLTYYSYSSPLVITDNRGITPIPTLLVKGTPAPKLHLGSGTLSLNFSDRALLFSNDYKAFDDDTMPSISEPIPTDAKAFNSFKNRIHLYNMDTGTFVTLACKDLTAAAGANDLASTAARIELTSADITSILNLYTASVNPTWGIKVDSGAFSNWWGVSNSAYLPLGPGNVDVSTMTISVPASISACAVSDIPPTKEDTGNFIFEFELAPARTASGVAVPFATAMTPAAAIFRQSDGTRIASGTFTGWSTRTLNGATINIASFKTSEAFTAAVDYQTPATLQLFDIKDIFDNPVNGLIASFVYNRSDRTVTGTGFTTASTAFTIDNVIPTVLSVVPGDVIGVTNADAGLFQVNFSEPMETSAVMRPGLVLSTGTTNINFIFSHWENSNQRAVFKNLQAITVDTPNGTWTYTISGGADTAGNLLVSTSHDVRVLSDAPPVAPGGVVLRTVQPTISPTEVINQPLSFAVTTTADLSITYQKIPTENLPHVARFYNSTGALIGNANVVIGAGTAATATFSNADFAPALGNIGPEPITVKLVDNAGNLTGSLLEIIYDSSAPALTSFDLVGIATISQGIYYYNSLSLGNLTAVANSPATDALRLTIASEAVLATTTVDMTRSSSYSTTFGSNLPPILAPGTYSIGIADAAGNLHTGLATLSLTVDNASPTVLAIQPSTVIGITAARMATFTVTFSERMDNTVMPLLELATSSRVIAMDFVGWADTTIATTAYYVNRFDIDVLHPSGIYTYRITNPGSVRDLAANPLNPAGNFTLDVQSKGPAAPVTVLSLQPDIFGSSVLQNSHYSTLVDPSGSASVRLDYSSIPPLNWPHQLLVYSPDRINVATLAIDAGSYIAEFPGNLASWTIPTGPDRDGHYAFRIIDDLGNIGPETGYLDRTLYLDRASATVNTLTFNDGGFGIASAGIRYFSPIVNGSATITLTTAATDSIRLIASGTATYTFDLASATTTHTGKFGGTLPEGLYTVSTADFAGNFSVGATSTFQVIVDSTEPAVAAASPSTTLGSPRIGAVAANGGSFQIIFSERMQTGIQPVVVIASTTPLSKEAPLKFVSWSDDFTCNFVSEKAIDDTFAPGTYSYIISQARDYAGNPIAQTLHGAFTVEIYARKPMFSATLTSRQQPISGNVDLLNQPFSPAVLPGVATLTVAYSEGPHSTPHQVKLYDSTNVLVRTIDLAASGTEGIAAVDAAFFGTPGLINSKLHRFTVLDNLGNYSATSTLDLIYDAVGPDVGTLTISNVSPASVKPLYYHNPALHGNLVTAAETDDASGPARLLLADGIATRTYLMTPLTGTSRYSYSMTTTDNTAVNLPDGTYGMTVVDGAGNFATGAASTAVLVVDRAAPVLTSSQISTGLYLSSGAAGAATFTLTFNEPLYEKATPTLSIATTSAGITCVCTSFAGNTATFTTSVTVTNSLPQGEYTWKIRATDLTGNVFDGASGTVPVRSRGPVVASIKTESMQATTASGSETLINQPFSFLVNPGVSTLSVQLGGAPDGNPTLVYLHYMLEGSVVASYPLTLVGNAATFSWSIAQGPQPAQPTTYNMFLVDTNGDYSLEQLAWRLDNATPTITGLSFTGGENDAANSTIYFNPFKHPFINTKFQAPAETEAPKLRVRSSNSTDTYELSPAGTGFWSTNFTGVYSRSTQAATRLPDGRYDIGMVDRAGNLAASGSENLYRMVIDTQNPVVSTYTMYVASQPVSWFAPSAGNLDIFTVTAEPLSATGAFYLEITNVVGTRINRLPLVASAGALLATWNGRNDLGNLVADGDYTFRASDYAGNLASAAAKIRVIASEFKASSVTQISSTSAKIWFNQELKSSTVTTGSLNASPSLTFNTVVVAEPMAILFTASQKFAHNQIYQISVASGAAGVRSIYGASLSSSSNQIAFTADGEGPGIVSHDFSGLTSQKEFKIVFNETLDGSNAGNVAAYALKNSAGASIALTQATLQTDQKSVKLTAAEDLVESQNYVITASGVTDILGNTGTGLPYTFQGRDLTPPVIKVSAFSNPANVNDIIVLASANEPLKSAPVLYVRHGSASTVSIGMQARTGNQLFMAGVSLNSANGSTGSLIVRGEDVSGNQGSGEGSFTIAYVAANIAAQILSADENLKLTFTENSLKKGTTVKILKHELAHDASDNGLIMASLQKEMRSVRGLRASAVSNREVQNSSELIPVSEGYEISIDAEKVSRGFSMSFRLPATATAGLGLFNQSGSSWKFITSETADNAYSARLTSSQIVAVMRDVSAPRISLDQSLDLTEPLRSARPEFNGQIEEYGAGLDAAETMASINGGTPQPVIVDATGRFTFKPLTPLTNGDHELVIRATDQTGNMAQTAAIRFQVALPLQIDQIMQYPNPARTRGFIRISANSGSLTDDLVKIRIYDTAGHKVAALGNVRAVKENFAAGGSRYLYDIPWDLRNEDGKTVANGVYIARVEVLDPLNPAIKVKKTCKLAVLR